MTAIMGCLSYVLEDGAVPAQRNKLLGLALHSCRSQMILLETLVDTSRLEHGELVAQKSAIKTRALLEACLGDVRGVASHLGVTLQASSFGAMPEEIDGDPDLLPRTICNLLHNAIKYTPPGGSVSLTTHASGSGVTFEVNDTGIGIKPENIERLFKKYYRVEGADQSGRRGSGLGLYFCRLVIEAHGGTVSVMSKVGRGTTVTFNIPRSESGEMREADRIDMELAPQPEASGDDERRSVMIIDDDNTIRATLQAALEEKYAVVALRNGDEVLELIETHHPELLILDINMPGSDGFEICANVRSKAALDSLPILFMTSRKDNKTFLNSLGMGGNAFITKPFEIAELRGKIEYLLANPPPSTAVDNG
jgi:two-component system sensor histidine kinase ChiS